MRHQRRLSAIRDLRPWLVRIAWNLALDRKRRVQPEQLHDLFAVGLASPERPADQVLAEGSNMATVLAAAGAVVEVVSPPLLRRFQQGGKNLLYFPRGGLCHPPSHTILV